MSVARKITHLICASSIALFAGHVVAQQPSYGPDINIATAKKIASRRCRRRSNEEWLAGRDRGCRYPRLSRVLREGG